MSVLLTLYNNQTNLTNEQELILDMLHLTKNHIQEKEGYLISPHCLMGLKSLSTEQPTCFQYQNKTYYVLLHGEIYNKIEIKNKLISKGYKFTTHHVSEIILYAYIEYHEQALELFNGAFSLIIYDEDKLFIARDQLGIYPLYYSIKDDTVIVANEIKYILKYLNEAIIDQEGIKELLALGPSMTPGHTIYKNIFSLRPGYFMYVDHNIIQKCYWKVHDEQFNDTFEQSAYKIKKILIQNIQSQLENPSQVSSMLSGGLDSSIITAITQQYIQELSTYSVTYEDQEKYFQAYDYQKTMDDDYIQEMVDCYHTNHHSIILNQKDLITHLKTALIARDMPGMADVDSSFLLFAQHISQNHTIALSGEGADEIFGGYPWFYKSDLYNQPYFPWMRDLNQKFDLFNNQIKQYNLKEYIIEKYENTLNEINTKNKKKQLMYLNIQWFLQTLLTRAYSQANVYSLTLRLPFLSTQLIQYLYNMPYEYMFYNNEEKGILRYAFQDFLPDSIIHRKKNPYPKTHSPVYTDLIYAKLKESLNDSSNILYAFFDKNKLIAFVESKGNTFKSPWFGQLMSGPQLMAYFYQIYMWGKIYHIQIK